VWSPNVSRISDCALEGDRTIFPVGLRELLCR
jgi:hypothetical protein